VCPRITYSAIKTNMFSAKIFSAPHIMAECYCIYPEKICFYFLAYQEVILSQIATENSPRNATTTNGKQISWKTVPDVLATYPYTVHSLNTYLIIAWDTKPDASVLPLYLLFFVYFTRLTSSYCFSFLFAFSFTLFAFPCSHFYIIPHIKSADIFKYISS
jgi:hypothetical protein